jgi:hypothetical protein
LVDDEQCAVGGSQEQSSGEWDRARGERLADFQVASFHAVDEGDLGNAAGAMKQVSLAVDDERFATESTVSQFLPPRDGAVDADQQQFAGVGGDEDAIAGSERPPRDAAAEISRFAGRQVGRGEPG